MGKSFPFVVAVASEKGGVGKTTIATNLAVFLKGLREDLPVTVASFDNHFSVDNMFAIGRHTGQSVDGIFQGTPAADLVQMGEYGVEFMTSERHLHAPGDDVAYLRQALSRSNLSGIFVLDTRPILDYFTQSALLAADLVLVPVKDRASLVNMASIRKTMSEIGGDPSRLWMVPSLIDRRLRLRENLCLDEFLAASGRERGYQVVDTFIAKSPKVEGLATNLTSRIYPILTHARTTTVYKQFKELAAFVLQQYDQTRTPVCRLAARQTPVSDDNDTDRHLSPECPVCAAAAGPEDGHYFQDLRTRRKGFLHGECLRSLIDGTDLETFVFGGGILGVEMGLDEFYGDKAGFTLHLFDAEGEKVGSEQVYFEPGSPWQLFLTQAVGRSTDELFRDVLLLSLDEDAGALYASDEGAAEFSHLRKKVLRDIFQSEV